MDEIYADRVRPEINESDRLLNRRYSANLDASHALILRLDFEQFSDFCNDLRRLDRFGDVGIGAELKRTLPVLARSFRRDDDDRNVLVGRVASYALDELEAIHDRRVDVRQDDNELAGGQLAKPVDAVGRLRHFQALETREGEHQEWSHHRRVFDDEAGG